MNQVKEISWKRWSAIIFYLLTIGMNYISQVAPFNGQTNGEVSDKYATFITPADYAFSIWGLIYLTLGIYVFYQALWAASSQKVYDKIALWLSLSFIATGLWLPAFQYEQIGLSVLIMLIILCSLIMITLILVKDQSISSSGKNWIKIPFGLYMGWISVATIVNISVWLKYGSLIMIHNELEWLIVMLIIGFLLALIISHQSKNGIYALVFVWAYLAIGLQTNQHEAVFTYAVSAALLLFILDIYIFYRQYKLQ